MRHFNTGAAAHITTSPTHSHPSVVVIHQLNKGPNRFKRVWYKPEVLRKYYFQRYSTQPLWWGSGCGFQQMINLNLGPVRKSGPTRITHLLSFSRSPPSARLQLLNLEINPLDDPRFIRYTPNISLFTPGLNKIPPGPCIP